MSIDEEAILRLRYEAAEMDREAARWRLGAAEYEFDTARMKYREIAPLFPPVGSESQINRYDGFPYRTKVGPPFQTEEE